MILFAEMTWPDAAVQIAFMVLIVVLFRTLPPRR